MTFYVKAIIPFILDEDYALENNSSENKSTNQSFSTISAANSDCKTSNRRRSLVRSSSAPQSTFLARIMLNLLVAEGLWIVLVVCASIALFMWFCESH